MAITRRILDGAKDSWARLTSMVIVDDEPLSHVEPTALHAELEARKAARKAGAAPAAAARMATSSAEARAERARVAAARTSRVHGERDRKAAADRSAADEAFARMKAQAGRPGGSATSSGPRPGPTASGGAARPARPGSPAAQVADWYKTLDVEPGADLATIKASYRKLMRKYHPDVHAGDPKRLKAATELSVRVTTAYNGLVAHLEKK